MQSGQLVEDIRQPLAFLLPVHVHSPNRVVQRFRAHGHLRGQRLFREMLHRTAQLEVLREIVFPVHAEHGLAHLSVVGVRLVGGRYLCIGVKKALVQYRHLTGTVVHAIVNALNQFLPVGLHLYRALRNVIGTQRIHFCPRAAELSLQQILVFLGNLLGGHLRGVI